MCVPFILSSVACLAVSFFLHYHKWHDFLKKKITEYKFFLNFSTTFVATFLILRIICQDILKYSYAFMLSHCGSCQILLKLEFSRQIFEVSSNTKFHYNLLIGSKVVQCRQS